MKRGTKPKTLGKAIRQGLCRDQWGKPGGVRLMVRTAGEPIIGAFVEQPDARYYTAAGFGMAPWYRLWIVRDR